MGALNFRYPRPGGGIYDLIFASTFQVAPNGVDSTGTFSLTDTTPLPLPPSTAPEPPNLMLLGTGLPGCGGSALRRIRRKA